MAVGPMVHLTSVWGSFHGRVLAARLGAEGIVAELRGALDGAYPTMGTVEVWVAHDQVDEAREVLLGDAVDAALEGSAVAVPGEPAGYSGAGETSLAVGRRIASRHMVMLVAWGMLVAATVLALITSTRLG